MYSILAALQDHHCRVRKKKRTGLTPTSSGVHSLTSIGEAEPARVSTPINSMNSHCMALFGCMDLMRIDALQARVAYKVVVSPEHFLQGCKIADCLASHPQDRIHCSRFGPRSFNLAGGSGRGHRGCTGFAVVPLARWHGFARNRELLPGGPGPHTGVELWRSLRVAFW